MFPEQLISSRNLQTLLVTSWFFFLKMSVMFAHLFIFIFDCAGSSLLRTAFICSETGVLLVAECGLTVVASLAAEHVLWVCGLRSCGTWALAAPWHVESSQTRDRTCFPCTGRQILIHWSTREFSTPCPFHTYL